MVFLRLSQTEFNSSKVNTFRGYVNVVVKSMFLDQILSLCLLTEIHFSFTLWPSWPLTQPESPQNNYIVLRLTFSPASENFVLKSNFATITEYVRNVSGYKCIGLNAQPESQTISSKIHDFGMKFDKVPRKKK